MLTYYFDLALRSFRRNKALTTLMVLAIALGIGASMTTLTVYYVLSGDPVPGKSDRLFFVQMDPRSMNGYAAGEEPPEQVTRLDAETLLREARGERQALMAGGNVAIDPERSDLQPFYLRARYTSRDMFEMFDIPFAQGRPWDAAADADRARVAVISAALRDKLFDGADGVGRTIRLDDHAFRVIGVLDEWRPAPRFYDLTGADYGEVEEVFLPFSTSQELDMSFSGNMSCWSDFAGDQNAVGAPCTWMQYWVELATPGDAADYLAYLANYSEQQRAAGRFERPTNVKLRDVMTWLDVNQVVPSDVRLQTWLAFSFLLVCLINTVGLLLAKFLRRSGEIGVRRALGASRRDILTQYLVEATVVGLAGGVLGLGLALAGLWAVRQQPASYADLASLDPAMLATTLALSLLAGVLAGVLPAWQACRITPAIQLKSQ